MQVDDSGVSTTTGMVITMYTPLTPRLAGRLAAPAVLAAMERSQYVGERERLQLHASAESSLAQRSPRLTE